MPAMKQPPTFSTGEPSYFVAASTPGSVSPTLLTSANASAMLHAPTADILRQFSALSSRQKRCDFIRVAPNRKARSDHESETRCDRRRAVGRRHYPVEPCPG